MISLKNINIDIEDEHFVTFLGESGSGKSTLLKIILGLYSDYNGDIIIDGKRAKGINPINLGISIVFQEPLLLPHLNVYDNIAFGLKILKLDKNEIKKRVNRALEEVKLENFEKRHPFELSGGQQQRVAIARALVTNPKILLMDEPFSALDQNLRIEMQYLLKNIQKEHKSTIIFVTHDRDEAFFLSNKIALMKDGEIIQYDSPENMYDNPKSIYTANFLGIKNIFHGEVKENKFIHNDFSINFNHKLLNKEYTLAIKPSDLSIYTYSENNMQSGAYILGVIDNMVLRHGFYEVDILVGNTIFKALETKLNSSIKEGSKVYINFNCSDIIHLCS